MSKDRAMVAPYPVTQVTASVMEQVVIGGDLEKLSAQDRVAYYKRVCESVGLNPFTKPFQYIRLDGKLTLYAAKDCAEQLRRIHGISITGLTPFFDDVGVYTVVATARTRDGRTDSATGAVPLGNDVKGEARANAVMKAETKAKRRVTLSISGLGWLDESETSSIPDAQVVDMGDDLKALPSADDEPNKPAPKQASGALSRAQRWREKLADDQDPRVATMGYAELRKIIDHLSIPTDKIAQTLGIDPAKAESDLGAAVLEMEGPPTYLSVARLIVDALISEEEQS